MNDAIGTLPHNPKNAVTRSIRRSDNVRHDIRVPTYVVKELNASNSTDTLREWRASSDTSHWNYWRRESLVYQSGLNSTLQKVGVRLPQLLLHEEAANSISLYLEDIAGRSGANLQLEDYAFIAQRWGAAQATLYGQPFAYPKWYSRHFLRRYTTSKPVDYGLLNSAKAWSAPLVRENWPQELQEGLQFLWAHSEVLYRHLEGASQVASHLDFWPNNVFVEGDCLVIIDLGFFGYGAIGEDIGNFIPDSVFDGFMPSQALLEMEQLMLDAYVQGWREGGYRLDRARVQTNIYASAVKYVWLGPLLLQNAQLSTQHAYGGVELADANEQYRVRGEGLLRLCEWAQAAILRLA